MSQVSANRSRKFSENQSYIIHNSEKDLIKKNNHLKTPLLNQTPTGKISNRSIQNSQASLRSSSCTNTAKKNRNSSSRINNRGASEEPIRLAQFYGSNTPVRTNLNMKQTFKSKDSDQGKSINAKEKRRSNWMQQIPPENINGETDTRSQNMIVYNSGNKEIRGRTQYCSKEFVRASNRMTNPARNRYSKNSNILRSKSISQTPNKQKMSQNTSYIQLKNYSSISNPGLVQVSHSPIDDHQFVVSHQTNTVNDGIRTYTQNNNLKYNPKRAKAGGKESMALWKNVSSPYQSEKLTEKRYNNTQKNTQFNHGVNYIPHKNQPKPKLNSLQNQLNTPPPDSMKHIQSKNVFADSRESPDVRVNSSQSRHIFLQNSENPSQQEMESMDTFQMSINGLDYSTNNSSLTRNNFKETNNENYIQINERKLKKILEPHKENYPVVRKRKNTIDKNKEHSSRQLFVKSKNNFQNVNRNSFGMVENPSHFEKSSKQDNQI